MKRATTASLKELKLTQRLLQERLTEAKRLYGDGKLGFEVQTAIAALRSMQQLIKEERRRQRLLEAT
jgi:hypothetical protein